MSFLERYHNLMTLIDLSMKGEEVDLEKLLQEATVLFQDFQVEYKKAQESDRKALIKKMEELQTKLDEHEQSVINQMNISEEELLEMTSNKDHYTPTQWNWMQRANKSVESAGRGLRQEETKKKRVPFPSDAEQGKPKKKKRRLKRSKWLKP